MNAMAYVYLFEVFGNRKGPEANRKPAQARPTTRRPAKRS